MFYLLTSFWFYMFAFSSLFISVLLFWNSSGLFVFIYKTIAWKPIVLVFYVRVNELHADV